MALHRISAMARWVPICCGVPAPPRNMHSLPSATPERALRRKKLMREIFLCRPDARICPKAFSKNWCAMPTASTAKAAQCCASRSSASKRRWQSLEMMCCYGSASFTGSSILEPGAPEIELFAAVEYYGCVAQRQNEERVFANQAAEATEAEAY